MYTRQPYDNNTTHRPIRTAEVFSIYFEPLLVDPVSCTGLWGWGVGVGLHPSYPQSTLQPMSLVGLPLGSWGLEPLDVPRYQAVLGVLTNNMGGLSSSGIVITYSG